MSSQEHDKVRHITTTVRLSAEAYASLKDIAEREHRSLSGQIRHWIQAAERDAA